MNPTDPATTTAAVRQVIPYESAATASSGPRRWWVYAILAVYLLLVGGLTTAPMLLARGADAELGGFAGVFVLLMILLGLALVIIPVKKVRRRPVTRRTILIPILASGLLLGGLVLGAGLAVAELGAPETSSPFWMTMSPTSPAPSVNANGPPSGYQSQHQVSTGVEWIVTTAAVSVWVGWSLVFVILSRTRDPQRLGMKLHRYLIAGSLLELLVAVPAHLVVRRRSECCAGILTGTGICIGVVVALVSLGPSVLLLFYQRYRPSGVRAENL